MEARFAAIERLGEPRWTLTIDRRSPPSDEPGSVRLQFVSTPPHGRVTFLFTDVEGSTRLWEEFPAAMRAALAAHDRILRSVIEAYDGYVFSTAGDAFSAAFWTAGEAVAAAVEAQRQLMVENWPEPVVLRVRMGIHTGTADEREGNYFGQAVNRSARIWRLVTAVRCWCRRPLRS